MMFSFNNLAHHSALEFVAPFKRRTSNREQNSWQQLRKSQTLVKVGFAWVAKLDSNALRRAREADTFSAGRGMFRRIPPQRKHKMTQDLLGRPFWREKKGFWKVNSKDGACTSTVGCDHVSLNTISFRHFGSSWILWSSHDFERKRIMTYWTIIAMGHRVGYLTHDPSHPLPKEPLQSIWDKVFDQATPAWRGSWTWKENNVRLLLERLGKVDCKVISA